MDFRPIDGVASRIADLRGRWNVPDPGDGAGTATSTTALGGQAFDPFGAVYQEALAARTAGGAGLGGASTASQAGRSLGAMKVPAELAVYGNGRVPAAALTPIGQGGHRLYAPAAESFVAMREAAAKDGVNLTITDSYRSYDQQVDLAARKGLTKFGGLAATPGTSEHGWGLAVDANVNDPRTYAWLQQNGGKYGWVQAVRKEPWHWEFHGTPV